MTHGHMLQRPCIGALAVPGEEELSESRFSTLSHTHVGQESRTQSTSEGEIHHGHLS
jgi:hypothetical protein